MGWTGEQIGRKRRALIMALTLSLGAANAAYASGDWLMGGQSIDNTRTQKSESKISPASVSGLSPKWIVNTGGVGASGFSGEVSATAAVEGGFLYFPTWNGKLMKVDRATGNIVWERLISDYTGVPGDLARTTPAISKDLLIFGNQGGRYFQGSTVIAVNKISGALVWATKVENHPASFITQSATVLNKIVYVGVASNEELYAAVIPGYVCCTFRGSVAALNADTGALIWKTYMTPDGFSGNAVWGSSPSIDTNRKTVYVATGNNYSAPQSVLDCIGNAIDAVGQRACLPADNYFDAVVALNMETGAVKWASTVIPFDVWTVGCIADLFGIPAQNCPEPAGPDFDFAQAPMIIKTKINKKTIDLVGVGQKSGMFWALNPDTGAIAWSTRVDTGGVAGGLQWGSSFDGTRIYTSSANSERKAWQLPDDSTTFSGMWSALDPATGGIIWQTANPDPFAPAGGAISSANGVAFACSQDAFGHMYALDGATGSILWRFASGGSCNAGAAVADGEVYWGSGYTVLGPPNTSNNLFHAFKLP